MIRVIAIDDHDPILEAIIGLIKEHKDIELVATAYKGSQLLTLVREKNPDVAIIDLGMPNDSFDPISAVRELHEQFPQVKSLILTGYPDGIWVRELMKAGASGYMLKSDHFATGLPQAIRTLHAGGKYFSPKITEKLVDINISSQLTGRELSVLNLLAQGLSTEAIADTLGISTKRVRNLLVIISDKLEIAQADGFSTRIAAVNKARKIGLLPGG